LVFDAQLDSQTRQLAHSIANEAVENSLVEQLTQGVLERVPADEVVPEDTLNQLQDAAPPLLLVQQDTKTEQQKKLKAFKAEAASLVQELTQDEDKVSKLLATWGKKPNVAKARAALVHHIQSEHHVLDHFAREAQVKNPFSTQIQEELKSQEDDVARKVAQEDLAFAESVAKKGKVAKEDLAFAQSVAKKVKSGAGDAHPKYRHDEDMPPELLHSADPEEVMLTQVQGDEEELGRVQGERTLEGFGEEGRHGGRSARQEGAGRHSSKGGETDHVSVIQERWKEQRHVPVSMDRKPTEGRLHKDFTKHGFGGDFAPKRLFDTCESAMSDCKASCDFAPPMMGDPGMCSCVSHSSGKTWTC
jgi:hypothetical protein